jgi:hypothetical protein
MISTRNLGILAATCLAAVSLSLGACATTGSKAKTAAHAPVPQTPVSPAPSSAPAAASPVPTAPAPAPTPPAPPTPPALLTGAPPAATTAAEAPRPRVLDKQFPQPPALDRDVNFWIRVYTEIGTNAIQPRRGVRDAAVRSRSQRPAARAHGRRGPDANRGGAATHCGRHRHAVAGRSAHQGHVG